MFQDHILFRIYIYSLKNTFFQLYTTFYIGNLHLVMEVDIPEPICGLIRAEPKKPVSLVDVLREYFLINKFCILEVEDRYIVIFKHKRSYWFFDPAGRDNIGDIIRPNHSAHFKLNCFTFWPVNLACVMKYTSLKSLALKIADNTSIDDNNNVNYILHPVAIKRKIQDNLQPPCTYHDFIAALRFKEMKSGKSTLELNPKQSKPEVGVQFPPKLPSIVPPLDPEQLQLLARKPIERPKAPSTTYFRQIFHEKVGILRSNYHQNDREFSKYAGKQSLTNAVAAIAMLREHKSRYWITKTVDDILITGEIIYMKSKENIKKGNFEGSLDISELTDIIKINGNEYKPVIKENCGFGKLNSAKYDVVDLTAALEEFFADHDTGITLCYIMI